MLCYNFDKRRGYIGVYTKTTLSGKIAYKVDCKCEKCSHSPGRSTNNNSFENEFFLLSIFGKYVGVKSALFFVIYLIDKEFNLISLIIAILLLGVFFSYRIYKDEKARRRLLNGSSIKNVETPQGVPSLFSMLCSLHYPLNPIESAPNSFSSLIILYGRIT